jgi:hypothetical protein
MKFQAFNPFPHASHDSVYGISARARRARMPARVLAAMLAIGLPLLQVAPAVAGEQVLEIPQVIATPARARSHRSAPDLYDAAPASYADATAGTSDPAPSPATVAANSESNPPDPNVGSISDYDNQPGENAQRPSIAFGGGARRSEPPASMTTELILTGLIVGMVALEIASSHHRHNR